MTEKLRFGILSTASIALRRVLPGMQKSQLVEIAAIASRDLARAETAANEHNIPAAYGSYEELLADPNVDAVYIPLPNDLHVEWAAKAIAAGKHVLCEKPLGMNVTEVQQLIAARDKAAAAGRPVKVAEAYMVALHPQWHRVRELIEQGSIGPVHLVTGNFSYSNRKPDNIRNSLEAGGGALLDIGCYLVFFARWIYGQEPTRVMACIDRDPTFGTDRLTSMMLDFGGSHFIASCSTQLVPAQRIQVFGATGRLEVQIPTNTGTEHATNLYVDRTGDLTGSGLSVESFGPLDQYTLQGDAFARAILDDGPVPVPLEQSLRIQAILDALFLSAASHQWQVPSV